MNTEDITPMDRTTMELLDAWHRGDKDALIVLVERQVPWLRAFVSKKMTRKMRRFETSEDVVQTVLYNLLRYTPPFRPQNEPQFRGLIARAVLNRLRDLHDYTTGPRDPDKHEHLPSAVSHIGVAANSRDRPEREVEVADDRAFVALAMQLIDPDDRKVIYMREWQELPYAEIGRKLAIDEDTARFRFNRAFGRLGALVQKLKAGNLEELTRDLDEAIDGGIDDDTEGTADSAE